MRPRYETKALEVVFAGGRRGEGASDESLDLGLGNQIRFTNPEILSFTISPSSFSVHYLARIRACRLKSPYFASQALSISSWFIDPSVIPCIMTLRQASMSSKPSSAKMSKRYASD